MRISGEYGTWRAALLVLTFLAGVDLAGAAPATVPLNGDFEQWAPMTAPAGWTLPNGKFPASWIPEERAAGQGFALQKANDPESPFGASSLYLNGRILSADLYGGYAGKTMRVSLWAKGKEGKFTLYLREHSSVANKILKWVAIAIDTATDEEWREYSTTVEMTPWHGDDAIQLDLDGRGVLVDNLTVEILAKENSASQEAPETICTIPMSRKAPTIDGTYTPEEWADSIYYRNGFIDMLTGLAVSQPTECRLASDGKTLYVAILAPIMPGGFHAKAKKQDDEVYLDDSMEFYINPGYAAGKKDIVYQIVINFAGVVFDMAQKQGIGQMERGWTCEGLIVKKGACQNNSMAVLEIAIPGASVGLDSLDGEWGLNVCRTLCAFKQFTTLTGGAYQDFSRMMRCRVDPMAPALRWGYGGKPVDGKFILDAVLGNVSGSAQSYGVTLESGPKPQMKEQRNLQLAAGATGQVELDLRSEVLSAGAFTCAVDSAEGKPLFRHRIPFQKDNFFEARKAVEVEKSVKLEFYPVQHKFNIRVSPLSDDEQARYGTAVVFLEGPDGKERRQEVEKPRFVGNAAHVTVPLDMPEPGKYTVRALLMGRENQLLHAVATVIEQKTFSWVGNNIGKDRVIVPPFTPMTYKRNSVACWGREHTFAKTGLPEQITAMDIPLLAGPTAFVFESADGVKKLASAKCVFGKKDEDRGEFKASLQYPGLRVALKAWMEYDGCLFYTLDLTPEGEAGAVKSFALEIPLDNPKLLHAVGDAIRNNSAFVELKPEDGILWSSREIKNRMVYGNFLPYVWIGRPEGGLSWFAENDRGWVNDPEHPCLEVIRQGKTVTLRVNFITGPTTLREPRHLEFGLMATPVKSRHTGAYINPDTQYVASFGDFFSCGLVSLDPTISKLILKPGTPKPSSLHVYTAGEEYLLGDPEFNYFYDEFARAPFDRYMLELASKKYKLRGDVADRYISGVFCWTPERVDYNLDRIKFLQDELDVPGVYLDNSYPFFCRNIQHQNCGYVREDGQLQAGCHLLLTREYIKRCATLSYLNGKRRPHFSVHNTDAMVIPAFAFAEMTVAGEMVVPEEKDHMDVFSLAQCETILGTHWGPTPGMLTMLGYGERAQKPKPTRAMLGLFKLYDITIYWNSKCNQSIVDKLKAIETEFDTCAADSQFVGYWDARAAAAVTHDGGDQVKASFFVRPMQGALIYITNLDREAKTVHLKLDFKAWGGGQTVLKDAETDARVEAVAGAFPLSIAGHDFRALRLAGE